jgi:hypothetical protein
VAGLRLALVTFLFNLLPAGAAASVAAAPEPVFLKTDHCTCNKNVKFSKIFMYMVLILTFFWKKRIFEFQREPTENDVNYRFGTG